MTGQSRPVNQRTSKWLDGLGGFQPRELHKHLLRGSHLDRSTLRQEFEQLHQAWPWSGLARFGPTTPKQFGGKHQTCPHLAVHLPPDSTLEMGAAEMGAAIRCPVLGDTPRGTEMAEPLTSTPEPWSPPSSWWPGSIRGDTASIPARRASEGNPNPRLRFGLVYDFRWPPKCYPRASEIEPCPIFGGTDCIDLSSVMG